MENETKEYIKPTVEWMDEYYDKFNQELFGGQLGYCDLRVFTSGKGSQGKYLGYFSIGNPNVRAKRATRRMYVETHSWENNGALITYENFADICKPLIALNGHYSATEEAWQNTLVHEMCHYYNYMYGYCPKQGHGREFREIAQEVSARSQGRFTISRVADAEEMKNYQLDDEMQTKKDTRLANKLARAVAILVYKANGAVELTLTSNANQNVLRQIVRYYENINNSDKYLKAKEIIMSDDPELIQMLFKNGYKKLMRTWKYWSVGDKPWIDDVKKYNFDYLLKE